MKPGTDKILARAGAALRRAQSHLAAAASDRALERAYAAIMHAARAVLSELGERPHAHAAIAQALARMLPSGTCVLSVAVGQALAWREEGETPPPDDVERFVELAAAALEEARRIISGPLA